MQGQFRHFPSTFRQVWRTCRKCSKPGSQDPVRDPGLGASLRSVPGIPGIDPKPVGIRFGGWPNLLSRDGVRIAGLARFGGSPQTCSKPAIPGWGPDSRFGQGLGDPPKPAPNRYPGIAVWSSKPLSLPSRDRVQTGSVSSRGKYPQF